MANHNPDHYKQDLTVAIEELRARYARCNSNYDKLQTKFFALLAGQLTVTTLIFQSYFNGASMVLPDANYGKVFFLVAVALLLLAMGLSFMSVSSNDWAEVPELKRILNIEEIKAHGNVEFLERLKLDYEEAIAFCGVCHKQRVVRLDWSIRLFVISVIILLVLKFGGA